MKRQKRYGFLRRVAPLTVAWTLLCSGSLFAQTGMPDSLADWGSIPGEVLPAWKSVGAISTVKGRDLVKSFTSNIGNTLYGRLPGLTVQQSSGEPGSDSPTLYGRGLGTFGSGKGLHVVVDGFPSTMTFFEQLAPQEIESIQLLKDAAATAIYGNRAANGVLLVTTRRGEISPLQIEAGFRYGVQQAIRLPEFLDAHGYATLYNEALANEGLDPMYDQADLEAYARGNDPLFHPNVDWHKELLRKVSPLVTYDLTARGGTRTVKYFVLFNGVNNSGLLKDPTSAAEYGKKQRYARYNFRTNVDVRLSNRLTANVTLGGSVEDKVMPGTSESAWNLFDLMNAVPANSFPVFAAKGMFGGNALYKNPLAELTETGYISYNGRSAQTSLRLTEQLDMITPGLSISGGIAFNTYFKSYSNKTREYTRYAISKDDSGEVVYTEFGQNTALNGDENSSTQWRNYAVLASLDYSREFNRHAIDATLRMNYDDYTLSGGNLPYKNVGLAGRLNYAFKHKYIAEFSFGYYGNDNFPRASRFGFFPAGALAWVLSEENFLKNSSIVDLLKVRVSYGMVGNSDIGGTRFMYNQYYTWGGYYYLGASNSGIDTYFESALANPGVTWEKEKKLNIGIEAGLFDGLSIRVDYFRNSRYDILTKPYSTVPDWLGVSMPDLNLGKVDNNGFEATVRYDHANRDVSYFVEGSVWYARNTIKFNAEAPQQYDYRYGTGHQVGQPFLLEAIGFFRDQEDIDNSPEQIFGEVRPGDLKYKDQNGDSRIDQDDFVPAGYTITPEYTLGLHAGMSWKGFDIDLMFQGALNRSVYWEGRQFQAFQNNGNVSTLALGRWTPETADRATYPRLATTGNQNNYQASTFWQKNGNFLKLRCLEIGYTINPVAVRKAGIRGLRVYVSGTNLFSIDAMEGYADPETLYGYPAIRTYNVGFNIQF